MRVKDKIDAWEKLLVALREIPEKSFRGLCIIFKFYNDSDFTSEQIDYLDEEIDHDVLQRNRQEKLDSNSPYLFFPGLKEPRIKYIEGKIYNLKTYYGRQGI